MPETYFLFYVFLFYFFLSISRESRGSGRENKLTRVCLLTFSLGIFEVRSLHCWSGLPSVWNYLHKQGRQGHRSSTFLIATIWWFPVILQIFIDSFVRDCWPQAKAATSLSLFVNIFTQSPFHLSNPAAKPLVLGRTLHMTHTSNEWGNMLCYTMQVDWTRKFWIGVNHLEVSTPRCASSKHR